MARTAEAEAEARAVARAVERAGRLDYDCAVADGRFSAMALEAWDGGKMIGVLVGTERSSGKRVTLKAFSGQLFGAWRVEGWAPPVGELTHDNVAYVEEHAKIQRLSERIAEAESAEKEARAAATAEAALREGELEALNKAAKAAQKARRRARAALGDDASAADIEALDEESRRSKRQVAAAKQVINEATATMRARADSLRERIDEMKTERKTLSQNLQENIWDSYKLPSLSGDVQPLRDVFHPRVTSIPCGCGDCAAPKLLAWAHARDVVPESIAEMWIGASRPRDFRVRGTFYGACRDKCVPIMGHLLCRRERLIDVTVVERRDAGTNADAS
ncbi:unnamed product [Ostreococcus tauri]|uniref:Unnamed product n=1 Tax=Ostreococcus tauri TaxID=70448 RepID=A0A090M0D7_OSTTA|nr:unnamed product [Ostreococcus tauri]CEF97715.1 unnamed product [Ostreococcus tauri]|eukprot:XP_022838845.1 unnamed product [Ostreococcus tauri]